MLDKDSEGNEIHIDGRFKPSLQVSSDKECIYFFCQSKGQTKLFLITAKGSKKAQTELQNYPEELWTLSLEKSPLILEGFPPQCLAINERYNEIVCI